LVVGLVVGVLLVGVERRVREIREAQLAAERDMMATYASVLVDPASSQPPAVRLASELRSLQRLRQPTHGPTSAGGNEVGFDAAIALANFLDRFPGGVVMTESIDASSRRLTLTAIVPTTEEAQSLAAALGSATTAEFPWRLRQPEVTTERSGNGPPRVRVGITLEPADSPRAAQASRSAAEAEP
jgi:hypothetical protein